MTAVPDSPPDRRQTRIAALFFVAALALVAAAHLTSIPLTIWEYDESLFAMAVEKYEPLKHYPPPPGYPLYIGLSKLVQPLFGYVPFRTLLGISVAGALAGFLAFFAAFRAISRNTRVGVFGSFLFYFSPAMLLHATLPQSDSGALALFGLSIWLCAKSIDRSSESVAFPVLAAVACAATVGWRLQFSIAVVPLFLTTVLLLRSWRERAMAVQAFALACLAWFIPLVVLTGGPELFWKWLSGQAAYFADHDADLSRSGRSMGHIALRFIAHPWGPKWLAAPVLLLAVIGVADAARRRLRVVLPVVVMVVVYLAFALVMMDPADGVRYALPSVPGVALLAVLGLEALRRVTRGILLDWAVVGLYALGAYVYTAPLLRQRVDTPSPPYAAIQHLRKVAPRNAVILFDMPLKPHAEYLLRGYTRTRVDEGLLRFGHRTDVPLFELTDSATEAPNAKVFRWETPDAYTKLTRGHYGAASVVPLPTDERFLALDGVSAPERTRTGSWRWIGARGLILLPDLGAQHVRLTFGIPGDYPFDGNSLRLELDGQAPVDVAIPRGSEKVVELPLAPGRNRLRLIPARTFVPAELPNSLNRDARKLSVMLLGVKQVVSAAAPQTGAQASGQ